MKKYKSIITIIFVVITIIYIIAGIIIFSDLEIAQSPKTTINIDIIEITSEKIILKTKMDIENPNSFDISMSNFQIITTTPDGYEVSNIFLEDKNIPANTEKSFENINDIKFKDNFPEQLITTITGNVKTGMIKKSISIDFKVITSLNNVLDIKVPSFHMQSGVQEISKDRLNLTRIIEIYNPNDFSISIENLSVFIINENNIHVGKIDIDNDITVIYPKSSSSMIINASILFSAIDSDEITILIDGMIKCNIAGANKTIPISTEISVIPPILDQLIPNDIPIGITLKTDVHRSGLELIVDLTLELKNPTLLEFEFEDFTITTYSIKNDEKTLIIEERSLDDEIEKIDDVTIFKTEVKLFFGFGPLKRPDFLLTTIKGNIIVKEINKIIPIEINGYRDLHLLS